MDYNYQPLGSDCQDSDISQICSRFIQGKITPNQIKCAQYILGFDFENTCKLVNGVVSGTRTDCKSEEPIAVISTPETVPVQVKCNGQDFQTQLLTPGVHEISTHCAIYHENDILVPQILKFAENSSHFKLTESSMISKYEIEKDLIIKIITPVIIIFSMTLAMCGGCICYFLNPDKCLFMWCRCCIKIQSTEGYQNPSSPPFYTREPYHDSQRAKIDQK